MDDAPRLPNVSDFGEFVDSDSEQVSMQSTQQIAEMQLAVQRMASQLEAKRVHSERVERDLQAAFQNLAQERTVNKELQNIIDQLREEKIHADMANVDLREQLLQAQETINQLRTRVVTW